MKMATQIAYEQGEEARSLGYPKDMNPYEKYTVLWDLWLNGWNDENKRGY